MGEGGGEGESDRGLVCVVFRASALVTARFIQSVFVRAPADRR